jgi:hypothetical protein
MRKFATSDSKKRQVILFEEGKITGADVMQIASRLIELDSLERFPALQVPVTARFVA